MCRRTLRTLMKPKVCKFIGGWEIFYWAANAFLIWCVWWKRERQEIRNSLLDKFPYETEDDKEIFWKEYNEVIKDWEFGVIVHVYSCLLFVPVALILLFAVHLKNKYLLLVYILMSLIVAGNRIAMLLYISRAYQYLQWLEFYWFARLFFIVIIFNYFFDLWDEETVTEQVEAPLLIQHGRFDDPRPFRSGFLYPEFPVGLEDRERVYGRGRHNVTEYTRYNPEGYPNYYVTATDRHGNSRIVMDEPPFMHL